MSLNKLVGADCGGNNTLLKLSSLVGRDVSLANVQQSDLFVNEFMAQSIPQQTFNMNSLLNAIPSTTNANNDLVVQKPVQILRDMPASSSRIPYQPMMQMSHRSPVYSYNQNLHPNVQIQYIDESELSNTIQSDKNKSSNKKKEAYNGFIDFIDNINRIEETQKDKQKLSREEQLNEIAEKYKDEWAKLSNVTDYWNMNEDGAAYDDYKFTEGNVMMENKSALEIGKEKLKMGDIPGAVVCFEAAVQQQPELSAGWLLLGTTQAENEQDPHAIAALKKCISIDPTELTAYINIAAAYINESIPNLALISLYNWLKHNQNYNHLIKTDFDPTSLEQSALQQYIQSLYIKAAQLNPSNIDPDVQNALGVFFNITQEYDKAIDCFKTALAVDSSNSKLWNRLGATLANSNRSEEAVDAYHQALNIEPGFIRARYNVGITCMNLNAHRQAAEHFIVALNQQSKAKSLYPELMTTSDGSSSTIWSSLRMVCAFMGEYDATRAVDERNLTKLNEIFNVE